MSAIFGLFYRRDHTADTSALPRMASALEHRSQDGQATWRDGAVGLGHGALFTTPESLRDRQPLVRHSGALVLTADARIDNRTALIATLGLNHLPADKIADSEILLAAYERWDERCPSYLLGDFAFAIWDGQRQTLFCARDHLGVKPFYYYRSEALFAFAAEIKALLALPEVPRRVNEHVLADHLLGDHDNVTDTFFCDIVRLPAGHCMSVSSDATRLWPYWVLETSHELRLKSDAAYAEAFRDVFSEAVRCRVRSAFPVGSMLSGGLDSSSIACVARDLLQREARGPLHTFSAVWPSLAEVAPHSDERRYVEAVIADGGMVPHYIHADTLSPLADLERVIWNQDEVHLGFNLYMDWSIFNAAGQNGVRVLMSGHDGDTTVSYGFEHLAELARRGHWLKLVQSAQALGRVNPKLPPRTTIWQFGILPLVPQSARQIWRKLRRISPPPLGFDAFLAPAFAQRVGIAERRQEAFEASAGIAIATREEHRLGILGGLNVHAFETFDKAASVNGVEPRYPFYDRRVVEFCLALPTGQKLHQGWTRSILRRAMEGILPPSVQWRKGKSDISANFKQGMLRDDRARLEQAVLHDPALIAPYFDIDALRAAYGRYEKQPLAHDKEALALFLAVITDQWLRGIDQAAPTTAAVGLTHASS